LIAWCIGGMLLVAWNGVLSGLASPFVLEHRFDAVQYQLLANYVQAHHIDGILIWEHAPTAAFRANPYGSLVKFERALQDSGRFDVPQVSGAWRWYPVRHTKELQ
jgi:hypothetical protein